MATYSNIGIKLITTGDESGTWGDTTNTNFSGVLDEAIAGVVTYNISSDADVTLTVSDGSSSDARHAVIKFTSTTLSATRTVTFAPNTLQKTWLVINSTTGGQSLTFKQGSTGSTVTVPNGESAWIYSDGAGATNGAIVKALDSFTNTKITTSTLNATTLDLTNLEVTNVKAKDGTAAFSIADSTGKVTVSSELAVDNLNLSGNAITSTNSNGNIDLTPNGSGEVNISKVDIDSGAIDGTTIGGASAAAGTFTTLTASTLGGALDANNQAITNINVDSGAIDGTPIGANSAATGAFTTVTATTGNITTVNATTVDSTNVEVTAIKAKDGTAAATIADSTGIITVNSAVLTTADINGGTIDGATIGGASAAAGTFTSLNSSSASTFNGGVVINELGADADTRIEGDTDANLFFVDASTDRIGVGTNAPSNKLTVSGNADITGNLGIGTSSPGAKVHADAAGTSFIASDLFLTSSQVNIGIGVLTSGRPFVGTNTSTNPLEIGTRAASPMVFVTDSQERMRLDSSGNLGLGVTPSAWAASYNAFQFGAAGRASALFTNGANDLWQVSNAYFNGSNFIYYANGTATAYNQASGSHNWRTAASGTAGDPITFTQAMTLDASGNLGIGTTSPGSKLHVNGAVRFGNGTALGVIDYSSTDIYFANLVTGGALTWYTNGTERARIDASGNLQLGTTTNKTTAFTGNGTGMTIGAALAPTIACWDTSDAGYVASMTQIGADMFLTNTANGVMVFNTNNTERARITAGGDLLVGKTATTAAGALISGGQIQGTVTGAASATFQSWNQATSGDNLFVDFYTEGSTGTQRGSIDYNRTGGLVRYNTTSDYRAKDIIGPLQNVGETIDGLKVYEGMMKGATESRPMLIAHEAQEYAPYAVSGVKDEVNEDGTPKYQQIDVSSLVPLLLAEIQTLRARVAALEAK